MTLRDMFRSVVDGVGCVTIAYFIVGLVKDVIRKVRT